MELSRAPGFPPRVLSKKPAVPPAPARLYSPAARVVELQQLVGNAAVSRLLQRQATAASEKSARPLVMRGSRGQGVTTLQQRLNARGQEPPLKGTGSSAR